MQVKLETGYVQIISPGIVRLAGLTNGLKTSPRAFAIFPCIVFRSKEEIIPWVVNHERIHFRQQLELAFIGTSLLNISETLYAICILRKTLAEAYLWRSAEQEAYRNQQDLSYLEHRPIWAQFAYLRNKRKFAPGAHGDIT